MTGRLQTNQPMMRPIAIPKLSCGGSLTQKVIPYLSPATKTSSTSPDASAPSVVFRRCTDQRQKMVEVRSQSPGVWHVRLEDGEEALMKRENPLVKESSPYLRSSNCDAGTQAREIYRQISSHRKPSSVSPSPIHCSMANEFKEPVPTTYGYHNVSEIKEPVPTTYGCRANFPSATGASPILGKSMVRTCQKPSISGLSASLRVATVRQALQTTCQYNNANEIKTTLLVTHAEHGPNEFHEHAPTIYGTNDASKSQAPVPTTCKSDEARELKELVQTTYGSSKTNKCTEDVQKLRTSSHASDSKELVPNELTEMVPKPRTCSNTNDLKEPVPTTYGCKNVDDLRLGSKVRLAGLKCEERKNKCGVIVQFDVSGVRHAKLEDGEEIWVKSEHLVIETINRGLSDSTPLPSKAKHDDGEAASVTNETLVVESSAVHNSAKCRSPTQVTSSCHLEALRPGSQARSPSKTLSLGIDVGSPSITLNSGLGGGVLVDISSPTQSTNQVVLREPVTTTYGHNTAKENKEPVPTTYGHNKAVESEIKALVPTTYGHNTAKELKEPVPTTYGHNKAVESEVKALVPTTYGHNTANELKEPVPTTYGLNKAVESEIKALVPTTYGHNTAKELKEPVPTTYGHNKAVESKIKTPVPTTYGQNTTKELKEQVPTTYGHNKAVESEVKASVPTTCGHNTAKELKEPVPTTYGHNKAVESEVKAPVATTYGHNKTVESEKLEDGEEISTQTENLVVENINHGHSNSALLLSSNSSPDVSDVTHAVWQQSTAVLPAWQHRSLSSNLLGRVATNSFFYASPWTIRDPSAAQPSKIGQPPPVKLVVFDFDCTLSVFHVFASLAGGLSKCKFPVPAPHARTERGQLQRLTELDAHPDWGPGVFAWKAFGGKDRVAQLRKALEALGKKGVECIICSRGYVGPIRKCLDQVNLLSLFSHTLGSLGNRFGTSSYDEAAARTVGAEHYLGSMDMDMGVGAAGVAPKEETITRCMTARGLKWCQVIYLDDDINEVKRSSVKTIPVEGGKGIDDAELLLLRVMVDAGDPCENENDTTPSDTPSTTASSLSSRMCVI